MLKPMRSLSIAAVVLLASSSAARADCAPEGKIDDDNPTLMCCKGKMVDAGDATCEGIESLGEDTVISEKHTEHLAKLMHQLETYVKPMWAGYLHGKDPKAKTFTPVVVEGTMAIMMLAGKAPFYKALKRVPGDIDLGMPPAKKKEVIDQLAAAIPKPKKGTVMHSEAGFIKFFGADGDDKGFQLDIHEHTTPEYAADMKAGVKWCECPDAPGVPFMPQRTGLAVYKANAKGARAAKDKPKIDLLETVAVPCGVCKAMPE